MCRSESWALQRPWLRFNSRMTKKTLGWTGKLQLSTGFAVAFISRRATVNGMEGLRAPLGGADAWSLPENKKAR